jgi:carbamoyl-phosphate synthase small subunit
MIPSKLILKSKETFLGLSPEWQEGHFFGEVVFTTGMTGYVESLTDPSYAGQILTFCYPLIGNYGVPDKTLWESGKIQASGVVIAALNSSSDHWNANQNFLAWLKSEKIPLIVGIDTRALTKRLRKQGVVLGAISTSGIPHSFPDPNLTDLVGKVSCKARFTSKGGTKRVIAVDCGMKENIMRSLSKYPIELVRVPHDYDYSGEEFDALFLSNGPGDPANAKATIAILQKALLRKKPTFGICLGAQLLALAIGAKTYKLPFGHRGHNQPCLDLKEKRAILTSQNHGYAIEAKSLPEEWEVTFNNLNDGSVEGIAHKSLPFFAVQFHPESCPGPTDAAYLFDKFYEML